MDFLTRIENKLGWHGVDHLPLYIVVAQAITYVWSMIFPENAHLLMLDPAMVIQGHEYWRLLTFLFITPGQNPLFAFFYLYLIYAYGMALEHEWGSFHFTMFYLVGAVGTMAAGLWFGSADGSFYLNTTIFLAFAALHPNFELLFFFVFPVKVKWLAWLTWAYFLYHMIVSPSWVRAGIAISLANYLLFFWRHHWDALRGWWEAYRHRQKFRNWDVR